MHNQTNWTKGILTWGLVVISLGLVMAVVGLILPGLVTGLDFIGRLLIAIGLVLIVLGGVSLMQYAYVSRDPRAGKQMMINEQDERMQWIRARAGQRAFWISSSLAFAVLIWASFASDVGLPTLTGNALWFSLLAVVVVPYIVYIIGIVYG
jgi:hypothetical protein